MNDPRKKFLTDMGASPQVADALLHGGWPDVDSPDHKGSPATGTKKGTKKYKHFKQEIQKVEEVTIEPVVEEPVMVEEAIDYPEGHCFSNASKWANNTSEPALVVHGEVHSGTAGAMAHAWVEVGDRVVDPTAKYDGPKDVYYEALKAKAHAKYEPHHALINAVRSGHQGPWREDEQFKKPLEESKQDFMDRYGTPKDIHHAIDSGDFSFAAMRSNPAFSREHHEKLLNHPDTHMNAYAVQSPHVTPDDLSALIKKGTEVKSDYLLNEAIHHKKAKTEDIKKVVSNPDLLDGLRANAVKRVSARNGWKTNELNQLARDTLKTAPRTFDAAMSSFRPHMVKEEFLEESKEDFLARTGSSDHIDKIIKDRYSLLPSILKNPAFSREHHEILMNHPDSDYRFYAILSRHVTHDDLTALTRDPSASIKVQAGHKLEEDTLEESKEDFLARHGTPEHISDAIVSRSRSGSEAALKNPQFSREHHEKLLASNDPEIRILALKSPHMTSDDVSAMIHSSTKDPWTAAKAIAHHLAKVDDIKTVALNHPNDDVRVQAITIVDSKRAWHIHELDHLVDRYTIPSGETTESGLPMHLPSKTRTAAENVRTWHPMHILRKLEEDTLEEGLKDDFLAKHGTAKDITDTITNASQMVPHENYAAIKSTFTNPQFSREHHEILINHENPVLRTFAIHHSPHLTDDDLNKLSTDPDRITREDAQQKIRVKQAARFMKSWNKNRPVQESRNQLEEDTLEESKEDFTAKYGSSADIHAMIGRSDLGMVHAVKNPAFSREHLTAMMSHENPSMRGIAAMSSLIQPDEVSRLSRDPDPYVRAKAASSERLPEADIHRIVHDPNETSVHVQDSAYITGTKRKMFTMGDYEKIAKSPHATHFMQHAAQYMLDGIKSGKPLKDFLKEAAIPQIQAGISRNQSLPEEPFSCYNWENKLVWVPRENIIADAKETHEGLSAMGEEFVLVEDGTVRQWEPRHLADELGLSRSVHAHYDEAGVNHYPYDASWPKIKAIHDFNFNSKLTNDFLHRNYHIQNRTFMSLSRHPSWDKQYHEQVPLIDSVFKDTTRAPINTMSGLKHSPQAVIDHARSKGHDVGDHIYLHLPAYTSTSTHFSTAMAFTPFLGKNTEKFDAHMFHIHIPEGHKLVGLETHPDLENGNEHELVLPRDTILRVNTQPKIYQVGTRNVHVWMSHVVGSKPTPLKQNG